MALKSVIGSEVIMLKKSIMKNEELLDEVLTDLEESLDTTLDILVDKGTKANLTCIREATQEELETLDSRRQTIREKVDMVIFLRKALNPEDDGGAWLQTTLDRINVLLPESAHKMSVALNYYYSEMSKGLAALKSDNSIGTEVLDVVDNPEYARLVDEAMETFTKCYCLLRFMVARIQNMNEKYLA